VPILPEASPQPAPASATAGGVPAVERSELLASKLEALRRRQVAVAVLTGLAMTVVVSLELLALAMFVDWWLELPWGLRLFSLVGQAAVLGSFLWRLVGRPLWRQPDEDALALLVEKARPDFRSRLIASVQLVRPGAVPVGASTELVRALVLETETMAAPYDFRAIISTERLKRFAVMAVIVPLLGLGGLLVGRDTCTQLLKRVLLSSVPVPRKTRVLVPERSRVVGIGDTVLLDAFVEGLLPGQGKVEVRFPSRRVQELALEQDRDNPLHFGRLLENVQESFVYRFYLGDGVSEELEVRAIPRPTVASIECEQEYPAYTELKPTKRLPGDLSLLAGSTLRLRATATKDLEAASLKLVGREQEGVLRLDPEHRRQLTGQFTVPTKGLTGFQFLMLDTDHMESRDSAVYRVDVLPDKIPVARLTYPERKEELVTRVATLLVGFDAVDDFRIAKVRLKYKADTFAAGAEKALELDLGGEQPARLRRRYEWRLPETLPGILEGSTIEYWIEVEDNNNATGPGIGSTDHQLAKVVSDAEKRADLLNRAGDYLSSISDVAADQEKLNQSLGRIIREKAGLR
jgi:hypothetical protein